MNRLFLALLAVLFVSVASYAQPAGAAKPTRGQYVPTPEFRVFSDDSCYDITVREADRAYRGGYWNDASKLYRAAKNCADADKLKRNTLNNRIEACRLAADQELRDEQQKAIRQARQAVATNRANDARELLEQFDRSLAFRLADFANEYIAPPDEANPACLQAIVDTWNYNPSVHSNLDDPTAELLVPFCYELAGNLDNTTSLADGEPIQLRFLGDGDQRVLYVFLNRRHELMSWRMRDMQAQKTIAVDTTWRGMEVSPDGETLVFYNNETFVFWRDARTMRSVQVPTMSHFCFDENGDTFYFFNPSEGTVYAQSVRDLFVAAPAQSKTRTAKRTASAPRVVHRGVSEGLLSMAMGNGILWLAYRDHVDWVPPGGDNIGFETPQTAVADFTWPWSAEATVRVQCFPDKRWVLFGTNDRMVTTHADSTLTRLSLLTQYDGQPLGYSQRGDLTATLYQPPSQSNNRLGIWHTDPSVRLRYGALSANEDFLLSFSGAFGIDQKAVGGSTPSRWFGAVTSAGALRVWELRQVSRSDEWHFGWGASVAFDRSGRVMARAKDHQLLVTPAEQVGGLALYGAATLKPQGPSMDEQPWAMALSDQRVAMVRMYDDTLLVVGYGPDAKNYFLGADQPFFPVLAFDESGKKLAYVTGESEVWVVEISDQGVRPLGKRNFEQTVIGLHFLPGSDDLLVLPLRLSGADVSSPRIWSYLAPESVVPRTFRLSDYNAGLAAVDPISGKLAFSDQNDVRIFDKKNLTDETALIRPKSNSLINALAYHPSGDTLAVGYSSGVIGFYSTSDGQRLFEIKMPKLDNDSMAVLSLVFADEGRKIRAFLYGGDVRSFDLDVDSVRVQVQSGAGKLVAFSTQQISEWELDKALEYEGNFEKLATSGDVPLIHAFFEFFSNQARSSNNIRSVGEHCDRAFELYDRLDLSAQQAQQGTLTSMFYDYCWKLLQRNQTAQADAQIKRLSKKLGTVPLPLQLTNSHIALLRRDFRGAARQYLDWLMEAQYSTDYQVYYQINRDAPNQFNLMQEYGLLDEEQRSVVCATLSVFIQLTEGFCEALPARPVSQLLSREDQLRYEVYQAVMFGNNDFDRVSAERIANLQAIRQKALELQRLNPTKGRQWVEVTTLSVGESYQIWGEKEQKSTYSQQHYRAGIALLEGQKNYSYRSEISRLERLASLHLFLGNCLLSVDPQAAIGAYRQGMEYAMNLDAVVTANGENPTSYNNVLGGGLYTQSGKAYLLLGQPDAARAAFETANSLLETGLNSWYWGHVAVLQDSIALADRLYEGANNEELLGTALAELSQMADLLPARAMALRKYATRLRNQTLNRYAGEVFDPLLVDYTVAFERTDHAVTRRAYDQALEYSRELQQIAQRWLQAHDTLHPNYFAWQMRLADGILNEAYYILYQKNVDVAALRRTVEQSEAMLKMTESLDGSFGNYPSRDLLYTNIGHAYLLLGQPERATDAYTQFLNAQPVGIENLYMDWRNLRDANILLPGLREVYQRLSSTNAEWQLPPALQAQF
jgi:hypothetical protein